MAGFKDFHPAVRQQGQVSVAALSVGAVPLPEFVRCDAGGISVVPGAPDLALQMQRFVDRVFASGAYFVGLDYATLSAILYGKPGQAAGGAQLHMATAIAPFPADRRELYTAPKIDDQGTAEYLFGPVWLQTTIEVPILGDPDEDGRPQVAGYETQHRKTPTHLDADEFVAAMWQYGVRCGLDMGAAGHRVGAG